MNMKLSRAVSLPLQSTVYMQSQLCYSLLGISLKDKSWADRIMVKQPFQLLNTNREFFPSFDASNFINFVKGQVGGDREFFPSFDASNFHKLVNESSEFFRILETSSEFLC